jgi:prevent-host-death family protein
MTIQFNIAEAKAKLSELVELALKGEEIVIARAGEPAVQLIAVAPSLKERRKAGQFSHWTLPEGDDWWKADPQDATDAEGPPGEFDWLKPGKP